MARVYNFSAGPAAIPTEVLEKVKEELLDYRGTGMSVMEMSHRGKVFDGVYKETLENLRKLASIPERFDILFMTGGASMQFALAPMNLALPGKPVSYINTGTWSQKAIEQAKLAGLDVHVAGSSEESNFNHVPDTLDRKTGSSYLHMTSNNTIFGTQFAELPDPGDTKLIIDASSDFLSRPVDWNPIGILYAGLQKNAGPSGMTVVIIDREYYNRENEKTPTLLRYSTYAKNDSMYNTPPTFQIYVFGLIVKWIEAMGGLEKIDAVNRKKAAFIYDAIDSLSSFYLGHSEKKSRSLMNVTFNLADKSLEQDFLSQAKENSLSDLKGHRSVGGMRASIYNAMPEAGCIALAEFMKEFAGKHS